MIESINDSTIDEFYENYFIKKGIELGIFKKLISTDELCICNVSNYTYMMFNYLKAENNDQIGLIVSDEMIQKYLKDEDFFRKFARATQTNEVVENYVKTHLCRIDEEFLKIGISELKKYAEKPNDEINLEMEEEIKTGKYLEFKKEDIPNEDDFSTGQSKPKINPNVLAIILAIVIFVIGQLVIFYLKSI